MKRTVPALVMVVLGLLGGTLVATPAPAYAESCSSSQITVVVQFPDRTRIGCAPGDAASGYAVLRQAFGDDFITYAQGTGAGAVCRLDGFPSNNNCGRMPPANAYWAYFKGKPGGGWTYSTVGGGSSNPDPGTVEGWRFQDSDAQKAPSISPPGSTQPAPSSSPTSKPGGQPTQAGGSKPTRTPDAPDATATASGTPTASPTATAIPTASASAGDLPSGTPTSTDADASSAPAGASSSTGDDSSGGLSWVWGLVLLLLLAGAGGVVALRRRGGDG